MEDKKIEQIAKACHNANRVLQAMLSEPVSASWEESSDHIRASAVDGVIAAINDPDRGPGGSHVGWLKFKEADGWVYGEVKDEVAKTHPCMVPYEQLPPAQKAKDEMFLAIVRSLS